MLQDQLRHTLIHSRHRYCKGLAHPFVLAMLCFLTLFLAWQTRIVARDTLSLSLQSMSGYFLSVFVQIQREVPQRTSHLLLLFFNWCACCCMNAGSDKNHNLLLVSEPCLAIWVLLFLGEFRAWLVRAIFQANSERTPSKFRVECHIPGHSEQASQTPLLPGHSVQRISLVG